LPAAQLNRYPKTQMGLTLGIGELVLASEEDDLEFLDECRARFALLSQVLMEHGLPAHAEPENFEFPPSQCSIVSFPYSRLRYLRRFAAHVLGSRGRVPPLLEEDNDPTTDPIVERLNTPEYHLIYHSDCEGYYVPIDFPQVIVDERVTGLMIGSTYRLLDELSRIAPFLEIKLDNGKLSDRDAQKLNTEILKGSGEFVAEKLAWFALYDAARQSLLCKSAIVFG
jgi:hypothetical protein